MKAVIPNTIDAPPKATYFAGFQMNLLVRFDEELLVGLGFELVDWLLSPVQAIVMCISIEMNSTCNYTQNNHCFPIYECFQTNME